MVMGNNRRKLLRVGTSFADEPADLGQRGENNRGTIALHARAYDHGLAWRRPEVARVRLEAQVEFPDLVVLAIGGSYVIGVAAMADRGDLA